MAVFIVVESLVGEVGDSELELTLPVGFVVGAVVAFVVGAAVAFVGAAVAFVGAVVAFVGAAVAFVGAAVAFVGAVVAFVTGGIVVGGTGTKKKNSNNEATQYLIS